MVDLVMHFRINIPCWGPREFLNLAKCVASLGHTSFRRELAARLSAYAPDRACLLTCSARFALALAIKELGRPKPRVAVPAYHCPAILTALEYAAAEPVFVDVAPGSFRFDAEALATIVRQEGVDAVLAPNTYGMDQDFDFLNKLGIPVIEDAAYQAGLVEPTTGRRCGLRTPRGVWSFNFKALTSVGGGVLFTTSRGEAISEPESLTAGRISLPRSLDYLGRSLLRHRIPKRFPGAKPPVPGHSAAVRHVLRIMPTGRMTEIQAALALAQWERREELAGRQARNIRVLRKAIEECVGMSVPEPARGLIVAHLFPALTPHEQEPSRNLTFALRRELHRRSIQTEEAYPIVAGGPEQYPAAHDLASRLLLLPCGAWLTDPEVHYLAQSLRDGFAGLTGQRRLTRPA